MQNVVLVRIGWHEGGENLGVELAGTVKNGMFMDYGRVRATIGRIGLAHIDQSKVNDGLTP